MVEYELTATADGSDWTIRERIVAVAGDSIVGESGPYQSSIRKGVQVTTRDVYRLQNGKLVSAMVGRFATERDDSVSRRRSEGTRMP